MLRPSLVLSLLTAMLSADTSPASTASSTKSVRSPESQSVAIEELSERLQIVADARRAIGNELRNLEA